uniref:T-box domain-containing protein n=1 Tax=Clastoptera arizonana TaxID=38151 RepID=A0A1B6DPH7_9HEMI
MTTGLRDTTHPAMESVQLTLRNADIWRQFHQHGTEMIITKSGRRMFPYMRLEITGLEADARYFVILEAVLSSRSRYKFSVDEWTPVGTAEIQLPPSSRLCIHPDSPATGAHWMTQNVMLNKIKLTNNNLDRCGNIVLTSMHKYLPRVHVVMASDILAVNWSPTATFTFPETEFIAVTAYQNETITKLKIDNNPFAKGFREVGSSRSSKRKIQTEEKCKDNKKRCLSTTTTSDDSGTSSIGSTTPPISEDELKMPARFKWPEISVAHPIYPPQLWSYPYFFHSPPPTPIYPHHYVPYFLPIRPIPEPYLMELTLRDREINISSLD